MSINLIVGNALSGLNASQAGLRVTSDNIANVNTDGYARQQIAQSQRIVAGRGSGVDVDEVRRIADQFLTAASVSAAARSAGADIRSDFLDRAQDAFGDPSGVGSLFDDVNTLFGTLAGAAADPASSSRRFGVISDAQQVVDQFARISDELQSARAETDARIGATVNQANSLLQEIHSLNTAAELGGVRGDGAGAENARAQLLDELSQIMDIRVADAGRGRVEVRTETGALLVGRGAAATLAYEPLGVSAPGLQYGSITLAQPDGVPSSIETELREGELRALIDLRDRDIPEIALQLGELAGGFAEAVNAAHNQGVGFPPPSSLTGRSTGLLAGDSHGFTGATDVMLIDDQGTYNQRVTIDFDAGNVVVEGGATTAFGGNTIGDVVTALNTALTGLGGSASFTNGQLTLNGSTTDGLAIADPATNAATRAGRGFSHFFGLNDLVDSASPVFFETGVAGADGHGFGGAAGQAFELELVDTNGAVLASTTVTPTAGGTFEDIRTALNNATTGLGAYGSFGAFGTDGELAFTPSAGFSGASLRVAEDTTARTTTGVSVTGFFGIGDAARAGRATGLSVRQSVIDDPQRLAFGQANPAGFAQGDVITGQGDSAGAQLLAGAGDAARTFESAGALGATTTGFNDYLTRVGADVGRRSATAERTAESASLFASEANARRASVEGVNLDEELVNLTQYQLSYNASSRLIQAASEMFDALLRIT